MNKHRYYVEKLICRWCNGEFLGTSARYCGHACWQSDNHFKKGVGANVPWNFPFYFVEVN